MVPVMGEEQRGRDGKTRRRADTDRFARRAAALRANLRRRKAQQKGRGDTDDDTRGVARGTPEGD